MPRSNWKGTISFGLVSIPIMLMNSENKSEKVAFHWIDSRNNERIKYLHVNAKTGKEVQWKNIGKGFQYDKETLIPFSEEEIQYESGEKTHTIEITQFIDKKNIHFIDVDKTYFVIPQKKNEKGYVILREALRRSNKVGVAKVIISTKEYISVVAQHENALVLYLLHYHNEIKSLHDLDIPSNDLKSVKVTSKEITIADQLIDSMTGKWKPEKYKDEFAKVVHRWAEKKSKHHTYKKTKAVKSKVSKSNVVDFVALLQKSIKKSARK